MFNFEEYEKQCEGIRNTNEKYLQMFEEDMQGKLKPVTINRHLRNVDFYLNVFLLRETPHTMQDGVLMLDSYLGDFFIRKCGWSTPGTIKSTAASIKKFYKCMLEHKEISFADFDFLNSEIKDLTPEWQSLCAQYNDPDEENPFLADWGWL